MARERNAELLLLQLVTLGCLLVAWQYGSETGVLNFLVFSSPTLVYDRLREWIADGALLEHVTTTMRVLVVGYSIGLFLGVLLGMAMGLLPVARAFFGPFIVFGNAMPRIVLVPFLVIWLGFGDASKVVLVAIVIVFVVAMIVERGVKSVRKDIVANARILGAGRLALARDVYLPGVALWLVVSARVCIGYALQAAILAEFFGSSQGLGYLIVESQEAYDAAGIYAALFVTMVIAIILDRALARVEARGTRWLPSTE